MSELTIQSSTQQTATFDELFALYTDAGWTAYTRQPDVLRLAFANSPVVLVARLNDVVVGLLRAVGDEQTIMYVQDIIVHSTVRKQGIGRALLQYFLQQYRSVRQIVLMTDNLPETSAFYTSCGFQPTNALNLQTFIAVPLPKPQAKS